MSKINEETTIKFKYWSKIIHDCKNSGMTTDEWLAQNGISRHAYYYWFKKIKKSAIDSVSKDIPVTTTITQNIPTFVEFPARKLISKSDVLSSPSTLNTVSATIASHGMIISISDNASSDFLLKLVGALSHVE